MTDIVERLRELARNYADGVAGMEPQDHFVWEAADQIERLRAALQEIRDLENNKIVSGEGLFMRAMLIARRALVTKP